MKKLLYLIIGLLLLPFSVFAVSNVDYSITKYNIEADITNEGNMDVCEYIKMNGSYNGYVRDLFYKVGDTDDVLGDLTNLKVYELDPITLEKSTEFIKVEGAYKGETLKYTTTNYNDGLSITMYNEKTGGDSGFVLCYTIEDIILIHNDVAELHYTFIPHDFEDLLKDVKINISLPQIDDTLRVWGHGALYGSVEKKDTDKYSFVTATTSYVNPGDAVNVRMTFDKSLVSEGKNHTNKNALEEIIEEETELANKANEERTIAKEKMNLSIAMFVGYLIATIVMFIIVYLKCDKEHKVDFDMEYYRDFPNTYGPEIVEYLTKKLVTTDGYSASILNMIYKKAIIIKETEDKKDYILTKGDNCKEELSEEEDKIIKFLFNSIGNGERVSIKDIKKYGKSESTANKFLNHFNSWKNEVTVKAERYNFFEKDKKFVFVIIELLLAFITYYFSSYSYGIFKVLSIVIMVIFIIYVISAKRKTKEGLLEYKKWMAFKKFLVDFGRFDEKELPEIILWEKYLVYATIFGVADKLEKTMKIKIQSFENNESITMNDTLFMHYMMRQNFTSTMNSTIRSVYTASNSTIASSHMSSGSGGGGGFSGGGGYSGGFGGGGGHGF